MRAPNCSVSNTSDTYTCVLSHECQIKFHQIQYRKWADIIKRRSCGFFLLLILATFPYFVIARISHSDGRGRKQTFTLIAFLSRVFFFYLLMATFQSTITAIIFISNVVHSVYGKFDGHSHSNSHLPPVFSVPSPPSLFSQPFNVNSDQQINISDFVTCFSRRVRSFVLSPSPSLRHSFAVLQQFQVEKFFHIFMCKRLHLNMKTWNGEKEKTELYSRKNRIKYGKWPMIQHRNHTTQ